MLMKSETLQQIKNKFKEELKDKEIIDIILFGSLNGYNFNNKYI